MRWGLACTEALPHTKSVVSCTTSREHLAAPVAACPSHFSQPGTKTITTACHPDAFVRADCWSLPFRGADGLLQPDLHRFPSGMKALADYVHSKGAFSAFWHGFILVMMFTISLSLSLSLSGESELFLICGLCHVVSKMTAFCH